MARARIDGKLLLIATVVVLAIAGAAGWGLWGALQQHRIEPEPEADGTPLLPDEPIPGTPDLRCGRKIVDLVKNHPSTVEGRTVAEEAVGRLQKGAAKLGKTFRVVGWRGREDRDRTDDCRVSLRYQAGEARGASVWIVDPTGDATDRLEPQDLVSVEVTARVPLDDEGAERALVRRCVGEGAEKVQRHFSFMENYSISACLRKTANTQHHREDGPEVEFGHWKGRPEGRDRCIVSVDLTEDGEAKTEYYRIRFMPEGDHALEPLTPRAIESIYGPHVYTR